MNFRIEAVVESRVEPSLLQSFLPLDYWSADQAHRCPGFTCKIDHCPATPYEIAHLSSYSQKLPGDTVLFSRVGFRANYFAVFGRAWKLIVCGPSFTV